jgi:hypothetical protein
VIESESRHEIKIAQPYLIKNLSSKFEGEVCQLKVYKTLGTPCFNIVRPDDNSILINLELQKRYRSGVGMLLYLTKYACPDLCNVVRELSKCVDDATMGTYTEMVCAVKFVLDTKNFCLKIHPKINCTKWNLKVFVIALGLGIQKQELALLGSVYTFKMYLFAGDQRRNLV